MSIHNFFDKIKSFASRLEHLRHPKEDEEDDYDLGSPIAIMMFEFLTQPESSRQAFWWNLFTCMLVVIRVLEIGVESLNGPNQYSDRDIDRARFTFLFTDSEYFHLYIACFVPLIVDAFARVVMMILLVFEQENAALLSRFLQDTSEVVLFLADTLGLLPFFIYSGYLRPNSIRATQAGRIIMRLLELLTTGRIFRAVRRFPAIRAITIALGNSFGPLVLPLFFFFVFNITTGVFFYFAEPCYNLETCPWINSFESTFFSIVTMTTTGYGNQVPAYELGRFVACCVMLFGSLYLSLPLAIIGNEYDKAWTAIQEEISAAQKQETLVTVAESTPKSEQQSSRPVEKKKSFLISNNRSALPGISLRKSSETARKPSDSQNRLSASFAEKRLMVQNYSPLILSDQILGKLSVLIPALHDTTTSFPYIAQSLCELRALLPTYQLSVEETLRTMYCIAVREGELSQLATRGARRFSIVGGGSGLALVAAAANDEARVPPKPFKFNNPFTATTHGRNGSRSHSIFSQGSNSDTRRASAQKLGTHNEGDNEAEGSLSDFSLSTDEDDVVPPRKLSVECNKRSDDGDNALKPSLAVPRPSQIVTNDEHSSQASDSDDDEDEEDDESVKAELVVGTVSAHPVKQSDVRREEPVKGVQAAPRNRQSFYNHLLGAIGVTDKHSKRRTLSENFLSRVKKVSENPDSVRSRIWILLELPHSSKEARALQLLIVFLVCLSIFVLYTQTITSLTLYGESTASCGKLLSAYCDDKFDILLDPGCFVQDAFGPTQQKLSFSCDDDSNCFGQGWNFGSSITNMTCLSTTMAPFQSKTELEYRYNTPYLFTSREHMHRINPVCTRIECLDNSSEYHNGDALWIPVEFITNIIFSIELVLRIAVAESLYSYWQDKMNLFDILAIFPFYMVVFGSIRSGYQSVDFSILSSSPEPIFFVVMRALKVFRLFKLTRHFRASKVLTETARRVWKQIVGMLSLLFFLVTLFSIIFFEMERGKQCFVGDVGCTVPETLLSVVHTGDVLYINKHGQPSQFPNMFFGVWFSFVTLTTTGYGDIVPVTNGGQVMGIFLMLAGSFYMAMPLTAAASTFYMVHEQDKEHNSEPVVVPEPQASTQSAPNQSAATKKHSTSLFDQRLLITLRYLMAEIKKHERIAAQFVDELFENRELWSKSISGNSALAGNILTALRNLEESMSGAERDLVDLLSRHHVMLENPVNAT